MKIRASIVLSAAAVILLIVLARAVIIALPQSDLPTEDIYQSFLEGQRINQGIDPYARILTGDMRTNKKYPTYFPLFYEFSFVSQKLGLSSFEGWIHFWLGLFIYFDYLIALLLFAILASRRQEWLGVLAAAFWLYNRWTLYIVTSANFDFIPIFFMLSALYLYPKKKWLALSLFSISLALKQIGIFIAPLFMVWAYVSENNPRSGVKEALKSALVLASLPLLTSLPFMVWNLEGFIKSIAFSATRLGGTHTNLNVDSLDMLLGWSGTGARIPMLGLLLGIYGFAFQSTPNKYLPAALTLIVFIGFNSVLFNQYLTWLLALVPLLMSNDPILPLQNLSGLKMLVKRTP